MNCTQAREHFAELHDERLTGAPAAVVRAHLDGCPACQREFASLQQTLDALDHLPVGKPSPRLRADFYALLEAEKHAAAVTHQRDRRRHRANLWRWFLSPLAACGLLALGFFAGQRTAPVPAPAQTDPATQQQIAALQEKVDSMGQLVGYSLRQQQPAGERLQGVLAAKTLQDPNEQVLTQLIGALALDPSTNVRLTALESLYPHADREVVRAGVLASLAREQNPLVQVAMIDFLVAARDSEAVQTFQTLANSTDTDRSVKEAARRAIAQF
jgi:hypothetical protein